MAALTQEEVVDLRRAVQETAHILIYQMVGHLGAATTTAKLIKWFNSTIGSVSFGCSEIESYFMMIRDDFYKMAAEFDEQYFHMPQIPKKKVDETIDSLIAALTNTGDYDDVAELAELAEHDVST